MRRIRRHSFWRGVQSFEWKREIGLDGLTAVTDVTDGGGGPEMTAVACDKNEFVSDEFGKDGVKASEFSEAIL